MKNITKKIPCLVVALACILGFSINAHALNKAVTIIDTSATKSSVTVSGTTEALAVMVQIRNAEGTDILHMESLGVEAGKFDGTLNGLNLAEDTKYKVFIADYEGGDWSIAEFTVKPKEEPTPEPSPTPSPEPSPGSTPSPKPTETPKPDGTPTPGGNQGGSSNNSDNGTASSPKVEEVPKTNDDNNILLWSIMLISGIVVMGSVGTVIVKKFNK